MWYSREIKNPDLHISFYYVFCLRVLRNALGGFYLKDGRIRSK